MSASSIYNLGYTDLVSIIPPDAPLAAGSKIRPESRGKSPGMRYSSGLWGGYNWQNTFARPEDIDSSGAGVGLLANNFPAIDIDVTNQHLATVIANVVERHLLTGPVRVGMWPKRLYVFALEGGEPFTRMQLHIAAGDERHLVEVLGAGQQYVVEGIHPKTLKPYSWPKPLVPTNELPKITAAQARAVLDAIKAECEMVGFEVEAFGSGDVSTRSTAPPQDNLLAADLNQLEEAVKLVPNTGRDFATREDYIRFGYAIKAASASDPERGFAIFSEWASRWTEGTNTPEVVRADWERMHPPFHVGAQYLYDMAARFGFNTAQTEFTVVDLPVEVPPDETLTEARHSDQWFVDQFIRRHGGSARYVPLWGMWMTWDGICWRRGAVALAAKLVRDILVEASNQLLREGATPQERRTNDSKAEFIASQRKHASVMTLLKTDPRITCEPTDFDNNPDLLGTPVGVINLRTGEVVPSDPEQMISRRTAVAAERRPCPLWMKYIHEACAGDDSLVEYLQRLAGYCLTGHTREQEFYFFQGPGGAGKGTYINTLHAIMGELSHAAQVAAFMLSKNDRHTTELAAMAGTRLVQAQETPEGRWWDEARVKSLSGGDPIAARFLFQNEFVFKPTFKLIFSGNNRPHLKSPDRAMRRRLRLIPFFNPPAVVDTLLEERMRAEMPAILHWMLEGAVRWYQSTMKVIPDCVQGETKEYFDDEDSFGRWLAEGCYTDPTFKSNASELFESWTRWCQNEGEHPATMKHLAGRLASAGVRKMRTREGIVYMGLRPKVKGFAPVGGKE